LKEDVRRDVTARDYNSPYDVRRALDAKTQYWKEQLITRRIPLGKDLQDKDGNPPTLSGPSNSRTGEGESTRQSYAESDAMGSAGPLAAEGVHPTGPR